MAKKRGNKNRREFELSPLNLVILLFALAFILQTCSPAAPSYDDLPPFPPAPGASGAVVFSNLLSGFQAGSATVVSGKISLNPNSVTTADDGIAISVSLKPADNEIWAIYRTIYVNGADTGSKVDNSFPRKTSDYTLIDPSNYLSATGQFTYDRNKLSTPGIYSVQITAYKLVSSTNQWEYPNYHVFEDSITVTSACTSGDTKCNANGNLDKCDNGQWTQIQVCGTNKCWTDSPTSARCGECPDACKDVCLDSGTLEVCRNGKKSQVSCFLCSNNVCLSAPGVTNPAVPACLSGTSSTTTTTTTGGAAPAPSACDNDGICELGEDNSNCPNDCPAATCSDKINNQDETDIDCGGKTCPACGQGNKCSADADCSAGLSCISGVCDVKSWLIQFGTAKADASEAVAVDSQGNVYVAGSTEGALSGQTQTGTTDAHISKFSSSGNLLWRKQFGVSGEKTSANEIKIIGNSLFLASYEANAAKASIRKYDLAGNLQSTVITYANGISTMDTDGSTTYTAGMSAAPANSFTDKSTYLKKFDSTNKLIWTKQFAGSYNNYPAKIFDIAMNGFDVYAVGTIERGPVPGQTAAIGIVDGFLIKYDGSGNVVWSKQFGVQSKTDGMVTGVATDMSGVYIIGNAGNGAWFVSKYDHSGNVVWSQTALTSSTISNPGKLAVSSKGVFGALGVGTTGNDIELINLDSSSGKVIATMPISTTNPEVPAGVAADSMAVYITGWTAGSFPGYTNPSPGSLVANGDAFVGKIKA